MRLAWVFIVKRPKVLVTYKVYCLGGKRPDGMRLHIEAEGSDGSSWHYRKPSLMAFKRTILLVIPESQIEGRFVRVGPNGEPL